jgi:hypothetical protein
MEEDKPSIQDIISALKTLRLREADLTTQLEAALQDKDNEVATATQGANTSTTSTNRFFKRGDRIWIKNRIHKPASWDNSVVWVEREAKTATVTDVKIRGLTTQVHFVADNGIHTWRAPNNIQLLT